MRFPDTGRRIIPFALEPVKMTCEKDRGVYIESDVRNQV